MRRNQFTAASRVATELDDDLIVTPEDLVEKTMFDVSSIFARSEVQAPAASGDSTVLGRPWRERSDAVASDRLAVPLGLRHFVPSQAGEGYWDFFRPLPHVMLSITDCTYKSACWTPVAGEHVFKVRILCSGRLLDAARRSITDGPAMFNSFHPRGEEYGYFIDAGAPVKLIIIHFFPEAIFETLELSVDEVPGFIAKPLASRDPGSYRETGPLSHAVLEAAREVLDSRYTFSGGLRRSFLQAKCREILTRVISDARSAELDQSLGARLSSRDRNIVADARDYLAEHHRAPPPISLLARRMGMNQTKLKAAFKRVTGTTIHSFVQEVRMRKASAMLLGGDHSIREIAYAVGYEHAANFTLAFKRYYGFLPRALKPKRAR